MAERSILVSEEGQRFFVPNIWPERPEGFAAAAERYYSEMERLTGEMMRLTAIALGQDEFFFDDKIDRHITAMRLNFYPEQSVAPIPGQLRAGDHTDYGMLTILNGENVPGGLQVKSRSGEWIDVETDPDTFVVNIGDLLIALDQRSLGFQRSPCRQPARYRPELRKQPSFDRIFPPPELRRRGELYRPCRRGEVSTRNFGRLPRS